jgi:hypothetical protein
MFTESNFDLAGLHKGTTLTREIIDSQLPAEDRSLKLIHGACNAGWTLRYAKSWQLRLYCAKCGAYTVTVSIKHENKPEP